MNNKKIDDIIKTELSDFKYQTKPDWDSFEKKLPKKKFAYKNYLLTVAAILLVITSSYFLNNKNTKTTDTKELANNQNTNITIKNTQDTNPKQKPSQNIKEQNTPNNIKEDIKTSNNNDEKTDKEEVTNNREQKITIEPENIEITITEPNITSDFNLNNSEGCAPLSINFNNISEVKNIIYNWDFGDGLKSNKIKPTHIFNKPGKYIITLTTTNKSKTISSSTTKEIIVYGNPTANFEYTTYNNTYLFEADECKSKIWKFGDNSFSNESNPTHTYDIIGKTIVTYISTNIHGCKAEKSKTIEIEPIFQIANAFSPNNDGDNDVFKPIFEEENKYNYQLSIFNSLGERIFESNNNGWNGKINNSDIIADKGSYLWKLIISDKLNNKINKKGKLTIK